MGVNCGVCLARDGEHCPCPTNHDPVPVARVKLAEGRELAKQRRQQTRGAQ